MGRRQGSKAVAAGFHKFLLHIRTRTHKRDCCIIIPMQDKRTKIKNTVIFYSINNNNNNNNNNKNNNNNIQAIGRHFYSYIYKYKIYTYAGEAITVQCISLIAGAVIGA